MKYAFRCKNCGHLHHAEHAGDDAVPHACCVCGKGVTHGIDFRAVAEKLRKPGLSDKERSQLADQLASTSLEKTFQPENWQCLCDFSEDQLRECGLCMDDVVTHHATHSMKSSKSVSVVAGSGIGIKNK
jgi:hypothetical protein